MQYSAIPIAMICDANFVMQTHVALTSLKINKNPGTVYEIYVILVDCDEEKLMQVRAMKADDFVIHILSADVEKYRDIKQMAHVPLASLVKFDICNLIPTYDKILYLDGDIIVREDLSDLYHTDLKDNYVAGVAHSLGVMTKEKKLNGGVLLFNARKIRDEKLKDVFLQTRRSLGERKSMDQETFHLVFGDKKEYLPPQYNVMIDKVDYEKKYYPLSAYNQFFGTSYHSHREIIDTAVIIHFTGSLKPWKYSFSRCAGEWFGYYQKTNGNYPKLERKNRWEYIFEVINLNGIRGLYWIIKDRVLAFMGAGLGIYMDKSHGEWN